MASNLQFTWNDPILDIKGTLPLSRPKRVQFVVVATHFNNHVVFRFSLGNCIQGFAFPILVINVLRSLNYKIISQLTSSHFRWFNLQYGRGLGDGIELEGLVEDGIVVLEPVDWVWLLTGRNTSLWSNQCTRSIWQHDVVFVCLVPCFKGFHNLIGLINEIWWADEGVQVLEHVLNFPGRCLLNEVLHCFDLAVLHCLSIKDINYDPKYLQII